jgi:hypothetical protein
MEGSQNAQGDLVRDLRGGADGERLAFSGPDDAPTPRRRQGARAGQVPRIEHYTPTTESELRRLIDYAREEADIRHDPLVVDMARAIEELMKRLAAHDAQALRNAADRMAGETYWGVQLGEDGSMDTYDSEREAREAARGRPIWKVAYELLDEGSVQTDGDQR